MVWSHLELQYEERPLGHTWPVGCRPSTQVQSENCPS